MRDPRITELARQLVHYSIEAKAGENVLIDMTGSERELVKALVEELHSIGAYPYVELNDPSVQRALLLKTSEEHVRRWAEWDLHRMKQMDAYIGIRAGGNINELSDVPDEQMKLYNRLYRHPVHIEERVKRTKWVVLRYPNDSMAQLAQCSTEAFEDFYFQVCNLDYRKMSKAMDRLVQRMNETDEVRIVSPGTDLTFSIKGIPAVKCDGKMNIPDGEVFTAPVKDSVNGTITFNVPSVYSGVTHERIRFRFESGKIVEASSSNEERLEQILDSDEGARYIGEFSLGLNPYILHPMNDILFDEKISGSLHLTPGQAYEEADNGNRSSIHWDLVLIQRPEYGGGEIYFDGELVRKDGLFVTEDLEALNPEHLK